MISILNFQSQPHEVKGTRKEQLTLTQTNFMKRQEPTIEGNYVPDVFMKTKYGSTNQYNYDIKEQNESEDTDGNHEEKMPERTKSKENIILVTLL